MKTIQFTCTKPNTANYTPADLMREAAKAGNLECVNGFWGECLLLLNGQAYVYHHWSVTNRQDRDGWHDVTIYLEPRNLLRLEHEQSAKRANA